jgi:hypothetical protein
MSTTFKATIEHVNHTTSRGVIRSHTMLVDRGLAKGRLRPGPAGGEYQLVALGGCFTSHLLAAIRAREAPDDTRQGGSHRHARWNARAVHGFTVDVTADCGDADLAAS